MNKKVLALSLFSSILVFSCVTVRRIDKKDSKNNLFSTELQNWMAVKHPQRIDTTAKESKSDTTISEYDSTYYGQIFIVDTNKNPFHSMTGLGSNPDGKSESAIYPPNTPSVSILSNGVTSRRSGDTVFFDLPPCAPDTVYKLKIRTITVHDTVSYNVVNQSEVNALKTYLQVSRDSTNKFILKSTQQQSTSRGRLIWIIVLGIVLAASGYFNIKNMFKI